jgi:hypothetical protein
MLYPELFKQLESVRWGMAVDRSFKTVQELNRYRMEVTASLTGAVAQPA